MSYDIRIVTKKSGETVYFKNKHELKGGTYAIGGIDEAWLNITYNYYPIFKNLFGEDGIRSIYNKDICETQQILLDAYVSLKPEDPDPDYWKCTEGNVRKALINLYDLADMAMKEYPETQMIWIGD